MSFMTDYNLASHELRKADDARHYAQQHGGYNMHDDNFTAEGIIPENWQEIVETERELQIGFSRPSSVAGDLNDGHQMYLQGGQEYNSEDDIDSHGQGGKNDIQEDQDHNSEEVPEPTPSRTRSNQMPPPPPPPQLKVTSTFVTTSVPTSKSSSYVEGSEDETPPLQPAAKKARIELDYDSQVLKTMSYADLDKQPFEKNPRAANTTTSVDERGLSVTLNRQLGNLSRMKEGDVRAMFVSQKDQEWEDTGAWFMSQFGTQIKRLMEIRQERRKIALKFEMEVKRRQAAVVAKTGDVEQELHYLKTGGKDLMEKRVSPMG